MTMAASGFRLLLTRRLCMTAERRTGYEWGGNGRSGFVLFGLEPETIYRVVVIGVAAGT